MSIEKWFKEGVAFDIGFLKENLKWRKDEPFVDNVMRIGATALVYAFLVWFIYKMFILLF